VDWVRIESSPPHAAPMHNILLTGAAGYIGSHTWLALLAAGFAWSASTTFPTARPRCCERLQALSGQQPVFERADVCDEAAMQAVFERHRIDATVHFAAFKAVGESTPSPWTTTATTWAACSPCAA
jgi:UDP-glucose 4-epimerase